ncbi:MAG TPA: diacylglycerol kinase family protein [Thermoanaerobaculia bacterium]|nr:diacylglycerol kinase family protein [Thermoanaerobaculia bacterium]
MVNPRAGGGGCGRRAPEILERLRAAGRFVDWVLEVHHTAGPAEGSEIARRAFERGGRDFLAIGGDGTAYEVLNGFLPLALASGEPCRLGLLPLGTGNSFVQHFLPAGHADRTRGKALALEALLADRRRRCDLLRLEHGGGTLYALSTVSLGFAAAVAHRVNRSLKRLGVLGYTLGVLLELTKLPSTTVEAIVHCGETSERLNMATVFSAVQNVAYTGGTMRMAPGADPTDGIAELVTLERVGRIELLRAFPRLFRGDHVEHPAVAVRRFDRLELPAAPHQLVMLDGEVLELEPRAVEVAPAALEIWI